ncbi:MAG TPA: acyclic terpene utilization AtuA family protein [Gemmatimonadota bacterium]|nr:acyclic terpene utilization AtuA family protein [Gemmatimonadota bacterium]
MSAAKKAVRIAAGQGFWGDWLEAPVRQVESGPIDYLVMDYLAEVTMSILQKQRSRDASQGYARDFIPLVGRILPTCIDKGIRIIANAGGVNPLSCRDALVEMVRGKGLKGKVRIGVITGDDLLERLDELLAAGVELRNMETGEPLETVRGSIQSANAYIGAEPMVEALRRGADVLIAGRTTDTALTYAPMMYEHGWRADDWDKLAAGVVAGHINECGAQATGGNTGVDWQSIDYADIGYPIIESRPGGDFVVTKHDGLGGRVTVATVTEQLLYEMGNPAEYITPDCIADFRTIRLEQEDQDRVRVYGVSGGPATEMLKVSISYLAGYKAIGRMVYSWPDAFEKARAADRTIRGRLERLGLKFDEIYTEYFGAGACHGPLAGAPDPAAPEVEFRIGVKHSSDRQAVERFTREIASLILAGPPTATGFGGGRPRVQDMIAYWPALIPKTQVSTQVEVDVA